MKNITVELTLPEKVLLLAFHDQKGTVIFNASHALPHGLAGAALMELTFRECLSVVNKNIVVADDRETGDPLLDDVLRLIRESARPRSPKYWVARIYMKFSDIKKRVARQLVEKGILRDDEQRFLHFFATHRYPMIDNRHETLVRQQLHAVVLNNAPADAETMALLSLVKACGLVEEVFAKPERRLAKQRIRMLISDDPIGDAVTESVQAAVVATVTGAITANTVIHS